MLREIVTLVLGLDFTCRQSVRSVAAQRVDGCVTYPIRTVALPAACAYQFRITLAGITFVTVTSLCAPPYVHVLHVWSALRPPLPPVNLIARVSYLYIVLEAPENFCNF